MRDDPAYGRHFPEHRVLVSALHSQRIFGSDERVDDCEWCEEGYLEPDVSRQMALLACR
jgi:hypothetical protein